MTIDQIKKEIAFLKLEVNSYIVPRIVNGVHTIPTHRQIAANHLAELELELALRTAGTNIAEGTYD